MNIKRKIEKQMGNIGRQIFRYKYLSLILIIILLALPLSQLGNIRSDQTPEGFLRPDDPVRINYNEFRNQFGRDDAIFIAIGPIDVFSVPALKKIKEMHEQIEATTPHLDKVTSLINARNTRGEGDSLVVEDLLEGWPEKSRDMEQLKKLVLSNSQYKNTLVSEDGRYTTLIVKASAYGKTDDVDIMSGFNDVTEVESAETPKERPFLSVSENAEMVKSVQSIIDVFETDDFQIAVAGLPVSQVVFDEWMEKDMQASLRLCLFAIAVLLVLLFSSFIGVLIPLISIILTVLTTLSLLAVFDIPLSIPLSILPVFLMAIGVAYSIHIMAIYYKHARQGDSKENAIVAALEHSALPIIFTGLTTAGGLISFINSRVAPVGHLGLFASVGIIISLTLAIVLVPTLLAILPKPKAIIKRSKSDKGLDKLLTGIADFAVNKPVLTLSIATVITGIAFAGLFKIAWSYDVMEWTPTNAQIRLDTETMDKELRGSMGLEIVLDTKQENGFIDSQRLKDIENLSAEFLKMEQGSLFIGQTTSLVDIVKETNKALNENNEEFYSIPKDKQLLAQELMLFENSGSEDLETLSTPDFSKIRLSLKMPFDDGVKYISFIDEIVEKTQAAFDQDVIIKYTGSAAIFFETITAAMDSLASSYISAFIIICVLMILIVGDIKLGFIAMIPNIAPIILGMGLIMGYGGAPLDMFSLMIGSIAIGLVVDDTIHFLHSFSRYYNESGDVKQAIHDTMTSTGRALLFTSMTLATGFFLFLTASLKNISDFGLIVGAIIVLALLFDFLVTPALLSVLYKDKKTATLLYNDKKIAISNDAA